MLPVTVVAIAPHSPTTSPVHPEALNRGRCPQHFYTVCEMDFDSTYKSEGCLLCLACLSTMLSISIHTDTVVTMPYLFIG